MINYVTRKRIQRPVLLLIDEATCHLCLKMTKLCQKHGIFPILFRPNTTHLNQGLDLTFFAPIKAGLKIAQEMWHRELVNIGKSLNRYTVMPLVHSVT